MFAIDFHIIFKSSMIELQAATAKLSDANKVKRKFSSFFKSLVIELDKDLYGPDNHLVEVPYLLLFLLILNIYFCCF